MRWIALFLLAAPLHASAADTFLTELEAWREQRAASLVRDDGWTALVGLHWLEPGTAPSIGSAPVSDIVVASLPAHLGRFEQSDGQWFLQLDTAQSVKRRGTDETLEGRVPLVSDQAAGRVGSEPTRIQVGSVHAQLIERGERFGLRVWDAQAPSRIDFPGLDWFDGDSDWRIEGRWIAHPPGRSIDIATVINTVEPMANPGAVEFQRDGHTYQLQALAEPGDAQLFFIFADRSNRRETYGAGRYLYAARPDDQGRVILDFNRAYNPPCAFTPYATCPLPPPENRLNLRVAAGERRFPFGPSHDSD